MNLQTDIKWIVTEIEKVQDPDFLEIIKGLLQYRKRAIQPEKLRIEQSNQEIEETEEDIETSNFHKLHESTKITEQKESTKPLPNKYSILKIINNSIIEYYNSSTNRNILRLSDVYDLVKNNKAVKKEINNSLEFSRFMRKMQDEKVINQFIKNCFVDTSLFHYYQWKFYPSESKKINKEESEKVLAISHENYTNIFPLGKQYKAINGVLVRSKQELYIYNQLLKNDKFEVFYERPITFQSKKIYPDFTIVNRESKVVFHWEHFGIVDELEYQKKMNEKIKFYKEMRYKSIDDGGRLILSIFRNEENLISEVERNIFKMLNPQ